MLLSLNFNNLSIEGYAAFILALIFTIITIASCIYFARHKEINKILNVLIVFVFPMLTILCWVYLLLNVLGFNVAVALGISFGCAVGYAIVAFAISALVAYIIKKKKEKQEVAEKTVDEPIASATIENEEEDKTAENKEEVLEDTTVIAPLMLTHEEPEQESTFVETENVENTETEETSENETTSYENNEIVENDEEAEPQDEVDSNDETEEVVGNYETETEAEEQNSETDETTEETQLEEVEDISEEEPTEQVVGSDETSIQETISEDSEETTPVEEPLEIVEDENSTDTDNTDEDK